jgi:anti-sigma B factor antagonist
MPQIEKKYIDPDIVLVEIAGRITLGRECQAVEWMVDELIRDNQKKVVFDLSGLEHVDSTGIGILVMCCGKMQAAGGEVRVAALQPKVAELMRVTKLNQIMVFYPTAAAAAENFELSQ